MTKYRIEKVTDRYQETVYSIQYFPQYRNVLGVWVNFQSEAGGPVCFFTSEQARRYIENCKKGCAGRNKIVEHIYD